MHAETVEGGGQAEARLAPPTNSSTDYFAAHLSSKRSIRVPPAEWQVGDADGDAVTKDAERQCSSLNMCRANNHSKVESSKSSFFSGSFPFGGRSSPTWTSRSPLLQREWEASRLSTTTSALAEMRHGSPLGFRVSKRCTYLLIETIHGYDRDNNPTPLACR